MAWSNVEDLGQFLGSRSQISWYQGTDTVPTVIFGALYHQVWVLNRNSGLSSFCSCFLRSMSRRWIRRRLSDGRLGRTSSAGCIPLPEPCSCMPCCYGVGLNYEYPDNTHGAGKHHFGTLEPSIPTRNPKHFQFQGAANKLSIRRPQNEGVWGTTTCHINNPESSLYWTLRPAPRALESRKAAQLEVPPSLRQLAWHGADDAWLWKLGMDLGSCWILAAMKDFIHMIP